MRKATIIKAAIVAALFLALVLDLSLLIKSDDAKEDAKERGFVGGGFEERNGSGNSRGDSRGKENAEVYMAGFSISNLPGNIEEFMRHRSYPEGAGIEMSDLRYLKVLHVGYDGETHHGELVVNRAVAEEVLAIFMELYKNKYPIEKIMLIDYYEADDQASMADNNTSAFCWREIQGGGSLSTHSRGLAIDINPLVNPYVRQEKNGSMTVLPSGGENYLDRDGEVPGLIMKGDACYEAFVSRGWEWGGDWVSMKDFQHFSKKIDDEDL